MLPRTISNIEVAGHKVKGGKIYVGWAPIALTVWDGYMLDPYRNDDQATGWSGVGIVNSKEDGEGFGASPEQHAAYFHLLDHQEEIRQLIIGVLKQLFPKLLADEYASYDTMSDMFPPLSALVEGFDFRNYIGPASINIEKDVKDGLAYLTWHFHCTWDAEHGFDVITHGDRLIELAPQADLLKINEDNGTYHSSDTFSDELNFKFGEKKKWWRFWS